MLALAMAGFALAGFGLWLIYQYPGTSATEKLATMKSPSLIRSMLLALASWRLPLQHRAPHGVLALCRS